LAKGKTFGASVEAEALAAILLGGNGGHGDVAEDDRGDD
jgi:hypothetical protein